MKYTLLITLHYIDICIIHCVRSRSNPFIGVHLYTASKRRRYTSLLYHFHFISLPLFSYSDLTASTMHRPWLVLQSVQPINAALLFLSLCCSLFNFSYAADNHFGNSEPFTALSDSLPQSASFLEDQHRYDPDSVFDDWDPFAWQQMQPDLDNIHHEDDGFHTNGVSMSLDSDMMSALALNGINEQINIVDASANLHPYQYHDIDLYQLGPEYDSSPCQNFELIPQAAYANDESSDVPCTSSDDYVPSLDTQVNPQMPFKRLPPKQKRCRNGLTNLPIAPQDSSAAWKEPLMGYLSEVYESYAKETNCGPHKAKSEIDELGDTNLAMQLLDQDPLMRKAAADAIVARVGKRSKGNGYAYKKRQRSVAKELLERSFGLVVQETMTRLGVSTSTASLIVKHAINKDLAGIIRTRGRFDEGVTMLLQAYHANPPPQLPKGRPRGSLNPQTYL